MKVNVCLGLQAQERVAMKDQRKRATNHAGTFSILNPRSHLYQVEKLERRVLLSGGILLEGARSYGTGTGAFGGVTADFNNDGRADIATGNRNANTVSVLRNNGDGTFSKNVDYPTGTSPQSVAAGDFNGDGWIDLVTSGNSIAGKVSVLLNNKDGTFATRKDYDTGPF